MSKYANKTFWVDTFDRAVSTFTQALAGALGGDAIGFVDIDWQSILGIAGIAALSSVLWSISYRGKDENDTRTLEEFKEEGADEYEGDSIPDNPVSVEGEDDPISYLGKHGVEEGAQIPDER